MKHACFVSLFLCLTTTFLLSQSNPVPLINPSAIDASKVSATQADPKAQARILENYGKLPLTFEANHGQTDGRVKFLARTGGYTLSLTGDEAVLALRGKNTDTKPKIARTAHTPPSSVAAPKVGGVLRMKLRHANPAAKVTGTDELAGTSNYFIGNDPTKWRTNVPTYAKVKYEGIYSGIDLVYYGNQRQLEYDFIVAPGADPRRIAFDVRGAKRIRRDAHGELVFKVGGGEIRWHKPVVYQQKDGTRQEIAAHYAITDRSRVGFELGKYDASRPLYIDPLIYSTFLGGSEEDDGFGIAVDNSGNAYVTGGTNSTDFPTMNPLQPAGGGAFVAKINPSGSALVYSTYLGGSGGDTGFGIAVDSAGNAYVTGYTGSTDFPTMNALQPTYAGSHDAFVAKINAVGSALVYSTYLGGSGQEIGFGIIVDSAGNAYVTGDTYSTDFPTMNPLQPANGGGSDAFVAKLNAVGSALVYSTYLGGSANEGSSGIAVDDAGNAYVTGGTNSTDFPTTPGAFQTTGPGGFVTKINSTGSALVYSTYLDGSTYTSTAPVG
jgi:Beta-propeller repeat